MVRRLAALLLLSLAAQGCTLRRERPAPPLDRDRLIAAYHVAVGCVDSVATDAGFESMPLATTSRRTRTWTLIVERPTPEQDGAEGHRLRLEYRLVPGRDSVQLVRAAAESFQYRVKPHELGPGRARSAKLLGSARRLAKPSAVALETLDRMQATCARLSILATPRELPPARTRIGD